MPSLISALRSAAKEFSMMIFVLLATYLDDLPAILAFSFCNSFLALLALAFSAFQHWYIVKSRLALNLSSLRNLFLNF